MSPHAHASQTMTFPRSCVCLNILLQFVPSVTELLVAQCYYLDFDDRNRQKPIYVYLNSTGCMNDKGQAIAADNEFYAIWAALGFTRAPLYTGVTWKAQNQVHMCGHTHARAHTHTHRHAHLRVGHLPNLRVKTGARGTSAECMLLAPWTNWPHAQLNHQT